MVHEFKARNIKTSRIIAVAADLFQIAFFPLTIMGGYSPLAICLDILVMGIMVYFLGFNWAFLPSFTVKLIPVANMIPTWTLSVLFATRKMATISTGITDVTKTGVTEIVINDELIK